MNTEQIEKLAEEKYPLTDAKHLQLNTAIRTGFIEGYKAALQKREAINNEDLHVLKQLRNYFGENDAIVFHQTAFSVIDKIIKSQLK